ncbi:flavin-containing monooxygenase [Agromyces sp. M3QZ16-3]|uniref:flavin-containing monooxygenase n=1 Tax=Agromyces sp. M3QZ16-3 TaxID=3447585 RepID=UPI003F69209A
MLADTDVLVIGAGQAGLAVSHGLDAAGIDHVVLERERTAATWSKRWDSFCLVTPNHTILLPGGEYAGDDPGGYLPRDAVVDHLRRYAASFRAPVIEHTGVDDLVAEDGGFRGRTAAGEVRARRVVVCTGAYQRERRPAVTGELARTVPVIGSSSYRSPQALPDGPVLVIGGGQSSVQISDELLRAGREVTHAAGKAPSMPRRVGGRDTIDWLIDAGFMEQTAADLPSSDARFSPNPLVTGGHGGEDLNLRTLDASGARLVGHATGVDDGRLVVADDLGASIAAGDDGWDLVCDLVRLAAERTGMPVPELPRPERRDIRAATVRSIDEFGAVVIACGYRPDYGWIGIPGIVDELGLPVQRDGASTVAPGLYFVGVPWMRARRSPLLMGVGEDARVVVAQLAA